MDAEPGPCRKTTLGAVGSPRNGAWLRLCHFSKEGFKGLKKGRKGLRIAHNLFLAWDSRASWGFPAEHTQLTNQPLSTTERLTAGPHDRNMRKSHRNRKKATGT